jgi:hypothetical protein
MKTRSAPRLRPSLETLETRELLSGNPVWQGYAGNPQHTALSGVASESLDIIRWQTPVDEQPQFTGNDLFIHYGSPLITAADTVIVPVKTGTTDGFRVEARAANNGSLLWEQVTDYVLPPHNWTPSFSPTLTPSGRLYFAGAGGTVYYINNPDTPGATITGQLAFYGFNNYSHIGFDNKVFIDTPITCDAAGTIYFGFTVTGATPLNLQSGIARIDANGNGTYVAATTAAGDASITNVVQNCAPALSNDGTTLYIAVRNGSSTGYLLALNSSDLSTAAKVTPMDPDGNPALLSDNGTASPTVGPDGEVYFGTLENPFPYTHDRGWLQHYSGDLSTSHAPGAFGWDDTASIVPAAMVSSYHGSSHYLLMTKYNNYAGVGGDGINKIAILDPNATETDPISGHTVMQEVLTIAGPTPDPDHPGGVREWCINSAAVDPASDSILANSEDGKLYRWDLATNTLSQSMVLTAGIGEAYTPTLIGADGTVYAINDATLFAVGVPDLDFSGNVSLPEGNSGTTPFTFTVALSNPSPNTVTVDYATADGTATAGKDYQAKNGTLTFMPGDQSKQITVQVIGNTIKEPDKTFFVRLSNPSAAFVDVGQATGTILNDDTTAALSIDNVTVTDNSSGPVAANFAVSLSAPLTQTVTVNFASADATASSPSDYLPVSGTLTFFPGDTTKTIPVTINSDSVSEPTKTFVINLSSPAGAILLNTQGVGTILNDDGALSVSDVTAGEGNSGTTPFTFTVSLANPTVNTVTVNVFTTDGTAHAGVDYVALPTTPLTFQPGQTSKQVTVLVNGNTLSQPNRNFFINLSNPVNAVLTKATGLGTIVDDDVAGTLQFRSAFYRVGEAAGSITVTITRVGGAASGVGVHFASSDGTAHAGLDYTAKSGDVVFGANETTKTFTIAVANDQIIEGNRTVNLTLSAATGNGLLGGPNTAVLTIADDDGTPEQRFVAQLYLDLLGRRVDPTGLGYWTSLLDQGQTRGQVALELETVPEYQFNQVNSLYEQYLGRTADPAGLGACLKYLQAAPPGSGEGDPVEQIRAAILGSQEYFLHAGGTINGFLVALYRDVLQRTPDSKGATAFAGALQGGEDRGVLASSILRSAEGEAVLGQTLYARLLHREIDRAGLSAFVNAMVAGLDEQDAVALILASPEYFAQVS